MRDYDFRPTLYDGRLVFSHPINGYASVGFSQQIIGRLDGMNECGLVVGLHFVNNEYRGGGLYCFND
ncbi:MULTISPECIES: carcinine hydrolase/isopenicillin-N N-acyltransferase family protein [unclassified Lysinibacillus]|uniref:carcinine hydrolase/isopenicillin-N N-acyltransferase family protein n=1 Tax=unclassified Lysinibacillus TaxID=2636778 RepID=UPI0038190687